MFKLATAATLSFSADSAPGVFSIIAHLAAGFGSDLVVVVPLLLLASVAPRLSAVAGVCGAVLVVLQVYFGVAFGSPATWHLLAYGGAVDVRLLDARALAAVAGGAVVVVATTFAFRRTPRRTLWVVCGVLGVCAIVGRVVDDGSSDALGLSRSPLLALVPAQHHDSNSDAVHDVSALDPEPPARRAPVVVTGERPRHVVLFISESTASRFVNTTTMPTLSALAADHGLSFVDHVAESPVSIKALFSLLCGVPPLPDATLETSSSLARLDCASLPEVLSAAGFDAGLFHGGYFAFTDKRALLNERGFSRLVDGEDISSDHWHNGWGTDDRVVVDEALAFLDARTDQARSSFIVVVPLVPHHEYFLPPDAPQPFGTGSMIARYKNGLHFADDVLRRLVDGYKARGLYDDSVFVVVGDHGEAFDEHPRNRLHGTFLFEENLRAPLVIHSPRALPAGAQTSLRPSTHADVRATILDLVDVTAPARPALASIVGHSLIASDYVPRASVHFTSYPDARVAWRGARKKLLIDDDSDRRTLFDIRADPTERRALPDNTDALAQATRATLHERRTVLQRAPRLDDTYLDRVAAAAHLTVREVRVFNMARRCLPFRASATDDVVLTLPALSPPATRVGFGIDDTSRQQRRGALRARITAGTAAVADLAVDSVFERSSTVATIAAAPQLTITIAPSAQQASGCVWVAP